MYLRYNQKPPEFKQAFLRAYNLGQTYQQIATQLGVSRRVLHTWRKQLGLVPRNRRKADLSG